MNTTTGQKVKAEGLTLHTPRGVIELSPDEAIALGRQLMTNGEAWKRVQGKGKGSSH